MKQVNKMNVFLISVVCLLICLSNAADYPACTLQDFIDYNNDGTLVCDCKSYCLGGLLTDDWRNTLELCGEWCTAYPGCNWYIYNTNSHLCTLTDNCDQPYAPNCPECVIGNAGCHQGEGIRTGVGYRER